MCELGVCIHCRERDRIRRGEIRIFLPGVTAAYNNGMLAAFGSAPRWVLRGPQDESRSRVSTIDAVVTLSPIFAVSQKQHFHFIFASSRARSSSALSSRMKPKRGYSSSRIR